MICNGKLYSAYIATKSGVNPVALLDKRGNVCFSFPSEDYYFDLRREAERMTQEELIEAIDPVINDCLKDLIYKNLKKSFDKVRK
ncbi:MAG: hypothetical protein E7D27_01855 [Clostridium celatum]|nr:hypothetical protein [Clostridium celatum]